jgi:hypothetical protein
MKLHIIFGQRKCSYAGEYAPEALAIADELTMEVNPDFLNDNLTKYRADSSFESVEVLCVRVANAAIDNLLNPQKPEVDAEILTPLSHKTAKRGIFDTPTGARA